MLIKKTLAAILFSTAFITPLYAADDLPTLFYQCGKKDVMVNYHDGDKLDLTVGHTTYIMHVVPSGSGSKYETDKAYKPFVEYWNKGDKISIDIDGKSLPKCRKVKAKK